jgi:hypothetical protein
MKKSKVDRATAVKAIAMENVRLLSPSFPSSTGLELTLLSLYRKTHRSRRR